MGRGLLEGRGAAAPCEFQCGHQGAPCRRGWSAPGAREGWWGGRHRGAPWGRPAQKRWQGEGAGVPRPRWVGAEWSEPTAGGWGRKGEEGPARVGGAGGIRGVVTPPAPACALLLGVVGRPPTLLPSLFRAPFCPFPAGTGFFPSCWGGWGRAALAPSYRSVPRRFASSAASGVWVLSLRGPRVGRVCAPGRCRGPKQAWDAGGSGALSQAPRAAPPGVFPEPQPQLLVGFWLELLCRLDPAVVGWGRHPAGPPCNPSMFLRGCQSMPCPSHAHLHTSHTLADTCAFTHSSCTHRRRRPPPCRDARPQLLPPHGHTACIALSSRERATIGSPCRTLTATLPAGSPAAAQGGAGRRLW